MAAATVTATTYGYRITGGTDATTVSSTPLRIKALIFMPDDNSDTVAITDYAGNAFMTITGVTADVYQDLDLYESRLDGMKVTLNDDGNVLIVLLC